SGRGGGLGLGTIRHLVPSQCSIKAFPARPTTRPPTAHTSRRDRAVTANRLEYLPPVAGEGIRRHRRPSQCSITGRRFPLPTDQASSAATAATPCSSA